MRHREGRLLLGELGTGILEPDIEKAVTDHVTGCRTCGEWLDTFTLFANGPGMSGAGAEDHPDVDLLALTAIRPEEPDEPDRQHLRRHLEHCASCRRIVAAVGTAVRQARPQSANLLTFMPAASRRIFLPRPAVLAAAAALLVCTILLGLFAVSRSATGTFSVSPDLASGGPADTIDALHAVEFDDSATVRSAKGLHVSDVVLKNGADVTITAGEAVAFGDGFRVESGARLKVASDRASPEAPRRRREPS